VVGAAGGTGGSWGVIGGGFGQDVTGNSVAS